MIHTNDIVEFDQLEFGLIEKESEPCHDSIHQVLSWMPSEQQFSTLLGLYQARLLCLVMLSQA